MLSLLDSTYGVEARGAVGRSRSKAIASMAVVVTGNALEHASLLTADLRRAPLGYVAHTETAEKAVELINRAHAHVAIFVAGPDLAPAKEFAAAVAATEVPPLAIIIMAPGASDVDTARALGFGYLAALEAKMPSRLVYRTIASLVQQKKANELAQARLAAAETEQSAKSA